MQSAPTFPNRRLAALLATILAATTLPAQRVLVVDSGGGPGTQFSGIQQALDAAADGDTVLVRSGTYGGATIAGKAVAVIADRGASVQMTGPVRITGLAATGSVLVEGVSVRNPSGDPVLVDNCSGAVCIVDSTFVGPALFTHAPIAGGGRITDSQAVTLTGCTLRGGLGLAYPIQLSTTGLVIANSTVQIFDSTLVGGPGASGGFAPSAPGGIGLSVTDSIVHVQGSSVTGGVGGPGGETLFGCNDGALGGLGLRVAGATTVVETLGAVIAGGPGGSAASTCNPGGPGAATAIVNGQLLALAGSAASVSADHPLREGESLRLEVTAQAGDLAWIALSTDLAPTPLRLPFLPGPLVVGTTPLVLVPFGVVSIDGTLARTFRIGQLPAAMEVSTWHCQVIALDTRLALRVGAARPVVHLDASF